MTAPTLAPPQIGPDVMTAAALVAGQDIPDASPAARALAEAAVAAADRQVMDDIVDALDAGYVPSGNTGPRVSDFGSCRRAVHYREAPPVGFVPDPVGYRRQAALGAIIHEKAAAVRSVRYPWRWYEAEVSVPGLDKKARIDEYDPVLGEVTDDKTLGVRRWDMVGDDGPDEAAWGQVMIYGYALDELGLPVRTVRIIAINRDTGDEEPFRRPYDPAAARRALDDLVELATMLDLRIVPPRDGSGPATDWRCRSCFARSTCWNIAAAEAAGRSPESYTILGNAPADPTIVWAGENLLAARAAKAEAEKAEKVARELVQGIEPGEYNDLVVSAVRRAMPEYKESFERTVELYALPEGYRPPVAEVAEPVKRIDRYTTVRRKRAAARAAEAKVGGSDAV